MANKDNINPIFIDTIGVVTAQPVLISSIIVIAASAAPWSVILKDKDGNIIFEGAPNFTSQLMAIWSPACSAAINGITADTLTNIKEVLVYVQ